MSKVNTQHLQGIFPPDYSQLVYEYLLGGVKWHENVPSKDIYHTHLVATQDPNDADPFLLDIIQFVYDTLKITHYSMKGIYLNYYASGQEGDQNLEQSHSPKSGLQVIISLGVTRTLRIGEKDYLLESGDVIVFDSSTYSVPIQPEIKEGRILISTFSTY